jgi:hypothetical protein
VAISLLLALATAPASLAGSKSHRFELRVLSSPPDMVTEGDALVRLTIPRNVPLHKAKVFLNGSDVTSTLQLDASARTLTGMVTGLNLGANIRAKSWRGVVRNKPVRAVDSCFATNGSLMHAGRDAWDGILDTRPAGPCTQAFPLFSTSRIVAGGPIEGGIFKCALQPVDRAITRGLYAPLTPSGDEVARLDQIFPSGVCDYSKPDVGRPRGF